MHDGAALPVILCPLQDATGVLQPPLGKAPDPLLCHVAWGCYLDELPVYDFDFHSSKGISYTVASLDPHHSVIMTVLLPYGSDLMLGIG